MNINEERGNGWYFVPIKKSSNPLTSACLFCFSIRAYFSHPRLPALKSRTPEKEVEICIVIFSLHSSTRSLSLRILSLQTFPRRSSLGARRRQVLHIFRGILFASNCSHVIHVFIVGTRVALCTCSEDLSSFLLANTNARQNLNMVVEHLKNFKQTPCSLIPRAIHFPSASRSHLMNFYFTSQQVTSGLMPSYTKRERVAEESSWKWKHTNMENRWSKSASIVANWMIRQQKKKLKESSWKFKKIKCNLRMEALALWRSEKGIQHTFSQWARLFTTLRHDLGKTFGIFTSSARKTEEILLNNWFPELPRQS